MTQFFAGYMAVVLAGAAALIAGLFIRHAARGPAYRRTKTYGQRKAYREFKVLGIANLEDFEDFITFLLRTFKTRLWEEDRELDDMVWVLGTARDWIEVYYDEHDGTRLRAPARSRGALFNKIEKGLKT